MRHMVQFYIAIFILLTCFFANTPSSFARQICSQGVERCQSLKRIPTRYEKCTISVCASVVEDTTTTTPSKANDEAVYENQNINTENLHTKNAELDEEEKQKTEVEACPIGQSRCNSLRDEPVFYWRCMKATCENATGDEDMSCEAGHKTCKFLLDGYWLCMSITCGTDITDFETCERGENQCSPDLNKYWNCVSRECLGSVEEFRNPDESYDDDSPFKDNIAQTPAAAKRRGSAFAVHGVREKFRFPPKGVDPRKWIRRGAPERILNGSPTRLLQCKDYTKSVACLDSRDIGTCVCSDGSRPGARREFRKTNPGRRMPVH